MSDLVSGSVAMDQFEMAGLVMFAGLALLLASIGLYGVMAHLVGQRSKELGLRMALGASQGSILRTILFDGMGLVAVGLAGGCAMAFAVTRALRQTLFGVSAADPATFIAVAVILVTVALLACLVPARRATRVDPMTAVRGD